MPLTNWVPEIPLSEYSKRFAEHATFTREDGILVVAMHTHGKEAVWSMELHRALSQIFSAIGTDPENELVIFTGTGNAWVGGRDLESYAAVQEPSAFKEGHYDQWYYDGTNLQERLLWSIPVPTIAVVNGPGLHTELAMLCDLTLAADDARFFEQHFHNGLVPGDGLFLVLQKLLGLKRANYYMLLRDDGIPADKALEWGMVNEVLPREELMPRAQEIAAQIMRQPRVVRRLTVQIVRRPWKQALTDDLSMHLAHEMEGALSTSARMTDKSK